MKTSTMILAYVFTGLLAALAIWVQAWSHSYRKATHEAYNEIRLEPDTRIFMGNCLVRNTLVTCEMRAVDLFHATQGGQ